MNKLFYIIIFLTSGYTLITGQVPERNLKYKAQILLMDSKYNTSGFITEVKDSSIVFSKSLINYEPQELTIDKIKRLKLRHKNAIIKGMVTGACIGMGIGILSGIISGTTQESNFIFGGTHTVTATEKAISRGFLYCLPGLLIGGLTGSSSISIPIYGKKQKYVEQKKLIEEFSRSDH